MNLEQSRKTIDEIDSQLTKLFAERMSCAAEIAAYKKENNLPVLDAGRERQKLAAISELVPEELENSARCLYSLIFSLSRAYQHRLLGTDAELPKKIAAAIEQTPNLFPPKAMVACQGVEGAYSQIACEKLFQAPNILYFSNFEAVFSAIEKGLCQYGIIPLENSTAGSVNKVYDLMLQHEFSIVRSTRLKVDHSLLVRPGTKLSDIREVYSHEQAIGQCQEFLKTLPDVQIIRCKNTAAAAKFVAESGRNDVAALASRTCGALYGLAALAECVQDQGNNYTRFICISKNLEIYPGADRTSLRMVLAHKPGALYQVLSLFNALGINLNKLESRPIPERDFEFAFYFDLDTSIYSPDFLQLMAELPGICEQFSYLGSYSEVI